MIKLDKFLENEMINTSGGETNWIGFNVLTELFERRTEWSVDELLRKLRNLRPTEAVVWDCCFRWKVTCSFGRMTSRFRWKVK